MKKVMIMGMLGTMMMLPMNVQAARCANGLGIEVKGNSQGTYCRSATVMNWWSAHAWCDAIGMKLVPMEECECKDALKCELTTDCPNLYYPSQSVWVWTATPHAKDSAYGFGFNGSGLVIRTRNGTHNHYALCMP